MKGNIGVTSKDIFPLIKKFMYNDHDIFIREIVSNAIDATEKLQSVVNKGQFTEPEGYVNDIHVVLDKENKTITVKDAGIGMTKDEVDKYINQIAFSSANEFLEKYSDTTIIGHFGLGFYSSFMVSDKVEIITKSYQEGSKAVKWECEGTTEYIITDAEKDNIGTDIVMHISGKFDEYLNLQRLTNLLKRFSRFSSIPIYIEEVGEDKPKPEKITSDKALWTMQPSKLKDEDYIDFYKELYPGRPEPLYWIHINIDMPFTFKGILYFPAFDPNRPIFEHKHLSLYSNRIFVTDNIEGILPEYLGLLHGIIDLMLEYRDHIDHASNNKYIREARTIIATYDFSTKETTENLNATVIGNPLLYLNTQECFMRKAAYGYLTHVYSYVFKWDKMIDERLRNNSNR